MDYSPWGYKESDMTERLSITSLPGKAQPVFGGPCCDRGAGARHPERVPGLCLEAQAPQPVSWPPGLPAASLRFRRPQAQPLLRPGGRVGSSLSLPGSILARPPPCPSALGPTFPFVLGPHDGSPQQMTPATALVLGGGVTA